MKHAQAILMGSLLCIGTLQVQSQCIVIRKVTLLSTRQAIAQPQMTVVVDRNRIVAIGRAAKRRASADCREIDGTGRFLIPGLIDTHVHFFGYSKGGEKDAATQNSILQMLVSNGVTSALVMEGTPEILQLRSEIQRGQRIGPSLFCAGKMIQAPMTGAPPGRQTFATPKEVQDEVEAERREGYDFVKVHGAMPAETYAALLSTGQRVGLPVIGHVPDNLGIGAALDGGQWMIAHAESYLQTYFEFHRDLPSDPREIEEMVREISERTSRAHVFVQPTLSVFRQIITQVSDPDVLLQRPEMDLLPSKALEDWMPGKNPFLQRWSFTDLPRFRREYRVMQQLVRSLRDAGVTLLIGTDDMVPMQLPGFAMRDEMVQLQEAGLTPYEVLQAATFNAARLLKREHSKGSIEIGADADLILLNSDPRLNIENAFHREGVVLHGRWIPESTLQRALWSRVARDAWRAGRWSSGDIVWNGLETSRTTQ